MLFAFLIAASTAFASSSFDLNDASVLLPLPGRVREDASLLKPNGVLPVEFLNRQGRLVQEKENASLDLRVVAIRLDPCFQESGACRRQIRLVWQPLERIGEGLSTVDAAAHSFYEITDDSEWKAIPQKWPRLNESDRGRPLQTHPLIKRESLQGPTWKRLRKLILEHCTKRTLSRVTVMQLPFTNLWVFRGLDIVEGKAKPIVIPKIKTQKQLFRVSLDSKKFEGGIEPRLPKADWYWNLFLKDSDEIKVAGPIQEIADVIDDMANPKRQNTATLDCASCHAAQAARRWVENDWRYSNFNVFPNRYENGSFNLESISKSSRSDRLRAFGYIGNEAVVSQRTVNETAIAVAKLNSLSRGALPQLLREPSADALLER